MKPIYETYRPRTFGEVIGQDRAVAVLTRVCEHGAGGQAVWLSGQSGTGKTTLARIVADTVADADFVVECDSSDLTVARLKEIEYESHLGAWGRGGRAFIVNEAHGLRKDSIRQLLVMLERIPPHVVWVFTTTWAGQGDLFESTHDAPALMSRCVQVSLTNQGLRKAFAARAREIAVEIGMDGRPAEAYERLAKDLNSNMRAMLQAVASGEML